MPPDPYLTEGPVEGLNPDQVLDKVRGSAAGVTAGSIVDVLTSCDRRRRIPGTAQYLFARQDLVLAVAAPLLARALAFLGVVALHAGG